MTNQEEKKLFELCRKDQNINDMERYFYGFPDGDHLVHVRGWYKDVLKKYLNDLKPLSRISECEKYKTKLDSFRKADSENTDYWSQLLKIVNNFAINAHSLYVEELKKKKGVLKAKDYANLFDEKYLTEDDFKDIGITKEDLNVLRNCDRRTTLKIEPLDEEMYIKDKYKLPKKTTELYFWGMPASGKSCCLSAILSTATTEGMCDGYDPGISSTSYFEKLTNIFSVQGKASVLIEGTNENSIANAAYTLNHPKYGQRRVCLIDLAGETFKSMHTKNNKEELDETRQLCLNVTTKYLTDETNRKLHFFIVPYVEPGKEKFFDGISTSQFLQAGVKYLLSHDIIKNSTDGIYIVVTKADMIGCSPDQYPAKVESYIKTQYLAFYNGLLEICKRNGIGSGSKRFEILPFSIGEMLSPEVCKFNAKGAERLLDIICEKSLKVSSRWWSFLNKLFGF
jgi:hypothetical protein